MFALVEHPQTNRQVESANRVLFRGLKRRLDKAKRTWAKEVPKIVWASHYSLVHNQGNTFQPGVWFGRYDSSRNPGELTALPELRGRVVQRREKGEPERTR